MRIYAPKYFRNFRCIADKCPHSCCIGWRISIDEDTERKYRALNGEYGDAVREHIVHDEEGAYIPLGEHGRCPHLSANGLCRIISEYGEEYIADICREHPRFYNSHSDRIEAGLGASCIEAARIILSAEPSLSLDLISEDGGDSPTPSHDAYAYREKIFEILKNSKSYSDAEEQICSLYDIPSHILDGDAAEHFYTELEYLDSHSREAIVSARESIPADNALSSRMLWYFLYRHLCNIEDESEARAIIAFALLSVRSVWSIHYRVGDVAEALRIYSEEIEYSPDNVESLIMDISFELI